MQLNFVFPRKFHPRLGIGAGAVLALGLAACDPCACVNGCARGYGLHSSEATTQSDRYEPVDIANRGESGMDCEIDEVPRSLRDGPSVLRVTIRSVRPASAAPDGSPRFQYSANLEARADPTDMPVICSEASHVFSDVSELDREELAEGESVCVAGNVRAVTNCTQKGCGY